MRLIVSFLSKLVLCSHLNQDIFFLYVLLCHIPGKFLLFLDAVHAVGILPLQLFTQLDSLFITPEGSHKVHLLLVRLLANRQVLIPAYSLKPSFSTFSAQEPVK